jgi:Ran GTPase-activating protein (RanGAP) involved in mRNA processing and transport
MSAGSGGAGAEECVAARLGAKNVVGAVLHDAFRFKCLLSFLDFISLQHLQVVSQAESEAHINYLRGSCKWYCFNAAQSACMPSSFVVHMQSNRSLQGLRITSPFVAEALESFSSKELQILDLQNTIKKGKLPCLLRVICTSQASLTELNLAKNGMTASDAILLAERLEGNQILTELNISSNDMGKRGAIALANIIPGMGAMTKLDMSKSYFAGAAAGKVIGDMLTGNSTLKDLDLSGCRIDSGAAKEISKGLAGNGALLSLDISKNFFFAAGAKLLAEGLRGNKVMTELNLAGNDMGTEFGRSKADMSGVTALADVIPGMRAISSVNLLKNIIGVAQAEAFVSILKEHPTLKSLCGNNGNETELDMSGKMKGATDAIMLVPEIIDNGAMTSLNLASNRLGIQGAKIIAAFLPKCK